MRLRAGSLSLTCKAGLGAKWMGCATGGVGTDGNTSAVLPSSWLQVLPWAAACSLVVW